MSRSSLILDNESIIDIASEVCIACCIWVIVNSWLKNYNEVWVQALGYSTILFGRKYWTAITRSTDGTMGYLYISILCLIVTLKLYS